MTYDVILGNLSLIVKVCAYCDVKEIEYFEPEYYFDKDYYSIAFQNEKDFELVVKKFNLTSTNYDSHISEGGLFYENESELEEANDLVRKEDEDLEADFIKSR